MKRYPIAKEYVKELNEHKYVEKATDWTVSFTEEFKQLVYDEYYRGKSISEIFSEAGFEDVDFGKNWNVDHVFIKGFDALDRKIKNIDLKLSDHPLYWVDLRLK